MSHSHNPNAFYEVQRILGKRIRNGHPQYLIKWKNYSIQQSTWEPQIMLLQMTNFLNLFDQQIQGFKLPYVQDAYKASESKEKIMKNEHKYRAEKKKMKKLKNQAKIKLNRSKSQFSNQIQQQNEFSDVSDEFSVFEISEEDQTNLLIDNRHDQKNQKDEVNNVIKKQMQNNLLQSSEYQDQMRSKGWKQKLSLLQKDLKSIQIKQEQVALRYHNGQNRKITEKVKDIRLSKRVQGKLLFQIQNIYKVSYFNDQQRYMNTEELKKEHLNEFIRYLQSQLRF